MNSRYHTTSGANTRRRPQPYDRPGLQLDAVTVAADRLGAAEASELLDQLSYHDPDDEPLLHAHLWQQIRAADVTAGLPFAPPEGGR